MIKEVMITESDKKYAKSLFPLLTEIKDLNLRERVVEIWVEAWKDGNYERIEDICWWEVWRDKFTWSNLDHSNQVAACAVAMAKMAQEVMGTQVNMDYLITGSLLHDVDKAVMFDSKTKEPTDWMLKMPHASYSAYMALRAGLPLDIVHMISTHTEYSLKRQMTIEALILHLSDLLIADLRNFKEGVDFLFSAQPNFYIEMPGMDVESGGRKQRQT